jgi:hypothetical protein
MTSPTREMLQALMDGRHGAARVPPARGPRVIGRKDPTPAGYAAPPGGGPEGETCGSCKSLFRNVQAKTYLKCEKTRSTWTGGRKTDVLSRSPACARWEAAGE